MSVLVYLVAGAVSVYVIVYYSVFRAARCSSAVKLKGKTAIVTGNELHLSAVAKTTALFKWSINCSMFVFTETYSQTFSVLYPKLLNHPSSIYIITNLNLNFTDKNVEI